MVKTGCDYSGVRFLFRFLTKGFFFGFFGKKQGKTFLTLCEGEVDFICKVPNLISSEHIETEPSTHIQCVTDIKKTEILGEVSVSYRVS